MHGTARMSTISSSTPSDSSCSSFASSLGPFVIIRGDSPLLGFDDDSDDPLHFPSPDYLRTLPQEPFPKSDWSLPLPPSVVLGLHKRASAVTLRKPRPSPPLRHISSSNFLRRADYIRTEHSDSYAGSAHLRSDPVDPYSSPSHSPVEASSPFLHSTAHISGPTSDSPSRWYPVDHTVKTHPSPISASHEETSYCSYSSSDIPIPSPSATEKARRGAFRSVKSLIHLGKKFAPEPRSPKPSPPKAPKPKKSKRLASLFDLGLEVYSTYV